MSLAAQIDLLQATLDKVRRDTEVQMRHLVSELEAKNSLMKQLERQVDERRDYGDLKKQHT